MRKKEVDYIEAITILLLAMLFIVMSGCVTINIYEKHGAEEQREVTKEILPPGMEAKNTLRKTLEKDKR